MTTVEAKIFFNLQGAHIYVSGSAQKMPQDVANTFTNSIFQDVGGLSLPEASKSMRLLATRKRYVVEAWS